MEISRITLLGVRGSSPMCGNGYTKYGGASAAVQVRMGGKTIVLDAGSGLLNLVTEHEEREVHILLSHAHLDHICGIPPQQIFYNSEYNICFYAKAHGELGTRAQVHSVMSPPLWPVDEMAFRADVSYTDLQDGAFNIGEVKVRHMEGEHPGGCTVFRLEYGGKSLVYATDIEPCGQGRSELIAFAENCGLLIIDGQYSAEKAEQMRGFGHMSREAAAQIGAECMAEHTVITHHDTAAKDEILSRAEYAIKAQFSHCSFGHCGEEFVL